MSLIAPWRNLAYLEKDDFAADQELARKLLQCTQECGLLEKLKVYLPILTGPQALGIALPSDGCRFFGEVYALEAFQLTCESHFRKYPRYQLIEKPLNEKPALWLRFKLHHQLSFEVIGQSMPVEEQPEFLATAMVARLIQSTHSPQQTRHELWQRRVDQISQFTGSNPESPEPPAASYLEVIRDTFDLPLAQEQSVEQYLLTLTEVDELELKNRLPDHLTAPDPVLAGALGG